MFLYDSVTQCLEQYIRHHIVIVDSQNEKYLIIIKAKGLVCNGEKSFLPYSCVLPLKIGKTKWSSKQNPGN